MTVVGVVLAGGAGRRADLGGNKVLVAVGGRTVLERSVDALAVGVDAVVVVARAQDFDEVRALVGDRVGAVVPGGDTRHQSEVAGVRAAASLGGELALVHDAARPLVPADLVARVVAAAATGVAVVPGLRPPVPIARWPEPRATATEVTTLLDRDTLVGVQTPQAAPVALLLACAAAGADDPPAGHLDTVEPVLRHRPDVPVVVVEGDPVNVKLTWQRDVARTEEALERGEDHARPGLRLVTEPPATGPRRVDLEVDGVVAVTDALRRTEAGRVVAAVPRHDLVDVTGELRAAPGTLDPDLAPDRAVDAAVRAGAVLRLVRASTSVGGTR